MSMSVPTESIPLRERINFRVVAFIAVFALLLGLPVYTYLDAVISGGLKNKGDYFEVDLKSMVSFSFDQNAGTIDDVPSKWRDLNGKTVLMKGEIAPGGRFAGNGGSQFELVYSVSKCCVGVPPQVQHFVKIALPPSARFDINGDGTVEVKGKLVVDVTHDPDTGKVTGVYRVVANDVTSL